MAKYGDDVKSLLDLVGGRENISAVSHCMTRMRFALHDPSKADVKAIEDLPSVKGTFTQAGQFQIIIGNDVSTFYNEFVGQGGINETSKDEVKSAATENQNPLQKAMGAIAEVFAPLIPAIICGGLILGFRNCIDSLYLFGDGTQTLVELSQTWAGIDKFLWLIGEAVFQLGIPVGICWSVVKKMGGTPMLGIVLGLTLVSSQLLNAYSVGAAEANPAFDWSVYTWDFGGGFTVRMIGYQAQVLPAIMAALTLGYLERFFRKICPQVVSMIFVPFLSLVLAVVAAHFVLGPIGWAIGSAISAVVYAGITGPFRAIFGAIFGFVYAPLVITGLHHMTNAIDLQLVADFGGTMLWPMIALSNIAQGSAVLAMSRLQKHDERAQQINIPSIISCYLGVTEPAMFGVNLKYVFPFFCAMIGSALAAVLCVSTDVTANSIGVGGLPGILSIQPQYMVMFAICMVVAVVVPFVLTYIVGKKKGIDKEPELEAGVSTTAAASEAAAAVVAPVAIGYAPEHADVLAPCDGTLDTLASVGDGVFSEGILGEGVSIHPTSLVLLSPADATVSMVMPESGHGVGLTLANGMEILIHIGLDTVKMKGEGFDLLVKQGDVVAAGTPLVEFDRDKIHAAGYSDTIIIVATAKGSVADLTLHTEGSVEAGKTPIMSY